MVPWDPACRLAWDRWHQGPSLLRPPVLFAESGMSETPLGEPPSFAHQRPLADPWWDVGGDSADRLSEKDKWNRCADSNGDENEAHTYCLLLLLLLLLIRGGGGFENTKDPCT